MAEPEKEAWYLAKDGKYLIRDSLNGNLHGEINISKAGKTSIYFRMINDACKGLNSDVSALDPLYINGTLVKFNFYCDGNLSYIMPATDSGRDYLIKEFK